MPAVYVGCAQKQSMAIQSHERGPGICANLIRNATEAAPPGSDVVVRIRSALRGNREGARIYIHDRGPGIPEEIRDRLFDPFFTTKGLNGSGLGL